MQCRRVSRHPAEHNSSVLPSRLSSSNTNHIHSMRMDSTLQRLPHAHPQPHNASTTKSSDFNNRSTTSQPSRYAFLNHSPSSVTHNLPPSVDDKPLARQRRRRTSPEDQTILEAAYGRDPKPDKAARFEIVKQVSLGEKEVQIWFQNRRQTSRRKSRPLLPHEIAQYQLARSSAALQLSYSDPIGSSSPEDDLHTPTDAAHDLEPKDQIREVLAKELSTGANQPGVSGPEVSVLATALDNNTTGMRAPNRSEILTVPLPLPFDGSLGPVRHVANQADGSSLRRSQSFSKPSSSPMHVGSADSAARLRKSSSFIRLATTGEGNAKVVTKDSLSPSPPHASQGPLPGPDENPAQRIPPMRPLQRQSSGRSRDSRVWEFWCDKEARTELEEKAEQDASGSAAGAIGLLRSASGRNILGSIPSKRNSVLSRQSISLKRTKVESAIPRLHKSSTALGRLEGKPASNAALYPKAGPQLKHSESSFSVHIPGNESDKENWSPSADLSPGEPAEGACHQHQQKGAPPSSNISGVWRQPSTIAGVKKQRASFSATERSRPGEDPEVAAFMGGARKTNSISGDEELDCVRGLLSLSQGGNWR